MNRSFMHLALASVILAGAGSIAAAQERPPLFPTRDVTINYKVLGRGGGQPITISQAGGSSTMRVDNPEMGGFALMDWTSGRATFVMTQMRMYMDMGAGQLPVHSVMPDKDAKFTRKGTDTVAGIGCTVWEVAAKQGDATACVTADGATLRVLTKGGDGMEATKVTFGPIPQTQFAVPAGFQKMDMPGMGAMPPGMGGQPRR